MGYPYPSHPNVNLTFNFADNAQRNTVQINMPTHQSNQTSQKEKKEVADLKEKFGTDMQKSSTHTPELRRYVSVNDIKPGVIQKMSFMDKLGQKQPQLDINDQLKADQDQYVDMLVSSKN